MSLDDIQRRCDAGLAAIQKKIDDANHRGDLDEADRQKATYRKMAAECVIEMSHDPEYTHAQDGMRGVLSALAPNPGADLVAFAAPLRAVADMTLHLADTVERHGENIARNAPEARVAVKRRRPNSTAKPEAAANKPAGRKSAASKPPKDTPSEGKPPAGRRPGRARKG